MVVISPVYFYISLSHIQSNNIIVLKFGCDAAKCKVANVIINNDADISKIFLSNFCQYYFESDVYVLFIPFVLLVDL